MKSQNNAKENHPINEVTIEHIDSQNQYESARFYLTNFINDTTNLSNQFIEFETNVENQHINFKGDKNYSHYKQELSSNRMNVAVTSIGEIILNNNPLNQRTIDKLTSLLPYSVKLKYPQSFLII